MSDQESVDPTRLTAEQLAKLLSAAYGKKIDPDRIQADVEGGAPVNSDKTINLAHYTAWQLKEISRGN
jgi:hypothetical protein